MKWDVCLDCQAKFGRRPAANLPCLNWGRNKFIIGVFQKLKKNFSRN